MKFVERTKEELERALLQYLATGDHYRGPLEAYQFNIKIYRIDVPDFIRRQRDPDEIDLLVGNEMDLQLREFASGLLMDYPWAEDWGQSGRSGGWLVLTTGDAVFDEAGQLRSLAQGRKRLRDIVQIAQGIVTAQKSMKEMFRTPGFWGIRKQDWRPGRRER